MCSQEPSVRTQIKQCISVQENLQYVCCVDVFFQADCVRPTAIWRATVGDSSGKKTAYSQDSDRKQIKYWILVPSGSILDHIHVTTGIWNFVKRCLDWEFKCKNTAKQSFQSYMADETVIGCGFYLATVWKYRWWTSVYLLIHSAHYREVAFWDKLFLPELWKDHTTERSENKDFEWLYRIMDNHDKHSLTVVCFNFSAAIWKRLTQTFLGIKHTFLRFNTTVGYCFNSSNSDSDSDSKWFSILIFWWSRSKNIMCL